MTNDQARQKLLQKWPPKLIVALDVPHAQAGVALAEKLQGRASMFKVGLESYTAEGPVLVRYLLAQGERVFLDLKFHDIPNTVAGAAREATLKGVSMFNVHAAGGPAMIEAAVKASQDASTETAEPRPLVLAVTALTSLDEAVMREIGWSEKPGEVVLRLTKMAQKAGADGVVASPNEVRSIREACGEDFVIVTPGIRPQGSAAADQSRISTPVAAVRAGADFLVVGRPITAAADPAQAAVAILTEIEQALETSSRSASHSIQG